MRTSLLQPIPCLAASSMWSGRGHLSFAYTTQPTVETGKRGVATKGDRNATEGGAMR